MCFCAVQRTKKKVCFVSVELCVSQRRQIMSDKKKQVGVYTSFTDPDNLQCEEIGVEPATAAVVTLAALGTFVTDRYFQHVSEVEYDDADNLVLENLPGYHATAVNGYPVARPSGGSGIISAYSPFEETLRHIEKLTKKEARTAWRTEVLNQKYYLEMLEDTLQAEKSSPLYYEGAYDLVESTLSRSDSFFSFQDNLVNQLRRQRKLRKGAAVSAEDRTLIKKIQANFAGKWLLTHIDSTANVARDPKKAQAWAEKFQEDFATAFDNFYDRNVHVRASFDQQIDWLSPDFMLAEAVVGAFGASALVFVTTAGVINEKLELAVNLSKNYRKVFKDQEWKQHVSVLWGNTSYAQKKKYRTYTWRAWRDMVVTMSDTEFIYVNGLINKTPSVKLRDALRQGVFAKSTQKPSTLETERKSRDSEKLFDDRLKKVQNWYIDILKLENSLKVLKKIGILFSTKKTNATLVGARRSLQELKDLKKKMKEDREKKLEEKEDTSDSGGDSDDESGSEHKEDLFDTTSNPITPQFSEVEWDPSPSLEDTSDSGGGSKDDESDSKAEKAPPAAVKQLFLQPDHLFQFLVPEPDVTLIPSKAELALLDDFFSALFEKCYNTYYKRGAPPSEKHFEKHLVDCFLQCDISLMVTPKDSRISPFKQKRFYEDYAGDFLKSNKFKFLEDMMIGTENNSSSKELTHKENTAYEQARDIGTFLRARQTYHELKRDLEAAIWWGKGQQKVENWALSSTVPFLAKTAHLFTSPSGWDAGINGVHVAVSLFSLLSNTAGIFDQTTANTKDTTATANTQDLDLMFKTLMRVCTSVPPKFLKWVSISLLPCFFNTEDYYYSGPMFLAEIEAVVILLAGVLWLKNKPTWPQMIYRWDFPLELFTGGLTARRFFIELVPEFELFEWGRLFLEFISNLTALLPAFS